MDINSARAMMNMMRSVRDPKLFLEEYAKRNSNIREVMDAVNKAGDPRTAFYQMASAKGVDPEAILSLIRK